VDIDRRSVLKAVASAGAASVAGAVPVRASTRAVAPPDAVGLLYDATLCIGCKACVSPARGGGARQDTRRDRRCTTRRTT
jgi:hypothetical protein